jgi:hypothetical protein
MNPTTENAAQSTLKNLRAPIERIDNLPSITVGLTSLQGFELVQRAAKCLAASSLVPKDYQNNIPNCVVALNMAARVGVDPLMVMQNLVVVHGKPTWSSQFLIATVNSSGRFSALRFEFFGEKGMDSWGCRAWAIEKETGEKLVGTDVDIALAKAEGWYSKNGSKWKTMPQQMLMYRAGSWWTRVYAPELSMGLHTSEEMRDVIDAEKLEDGSYGVTLNELRNHEPTDAATITPAHDLEAGEIIEPRKALAPTSLPVLKMPDDETKADWESWTMNFQAHALGASTLDDLDKLMKLNKSQLGNLEKTNPPKHGWCLEQVESRKSAVLGSIVP